MLPLDDKAVHFLQQFRAVFKVHISLIPAQLYNNTTDVQGCNLLYSAPFKMTGHHAVYFRFSNPKLKAVVLNLITVTRPFHEVRFVKLKIIDFDFGF